MAKKHVFIESRISLFSMICPIDYLSLPLYTVPYLALIKLSGPNIGLFMLFSIIFSFFKPFRYFFDFMHKSNVTKNSTPLYSLTIDYLKITKQIFVPY